MNITSGLLEMIDELNEYSTLFHSLDEKASEFTKLRFKGERGRGQSRMSLS